MKAEPTDNLATMSFELNELPHIENLIERLQNSFNTIEDKEFADTCQLIGQEMPYL